MNWQNISYWWLEVLPGLMLIGWIYSEVERSRRLRILGDPAVMGVSVPWALRLVALVALLAGVACTAAVVPSAGSRDARAETTSPGIEILLDIRSLQNLDDSAWEAFDSSMQILFDQAEGSRFAAVALGESTPVLVYPTFDTQGLQMVLARMRSGIRSETKAGLREALGNYLASKTSESASIRRVIVTAMPADEVERTVDALPTGLRDVLFAQIPDGGGGLRYLRSDRSGMPAWTARPAQIQSFLRSTPAQPDRASRLDTSQWLALTALLLLGLEYICRNLARSRNGRYHLG